MTLGRERQRFVGPARPEPSAVHSDPEVDRVAAQVAGILRRERRAPPIEAAPVPTPEPTEPAPEQQESNMAFSSQPVTIAAKGPVLDAIRARAAGEDTTMGIAALRLVEQGLGVAEVPADTAPTLADASIPELLDALRARLDGAAPAEELRAAVAAKEAAEGQLAIVKNQLKSVFADL